MLMHVQTRMYLSANASGIDLLLDKFVVDIRPHFNGDFNL